MRVSLALPALGAAGLLPGLAMPASSQESPATDFKDRKNLAVFIEARAVFLRAWGNPLETMPNRTFMGAELTGAFGFLGNIAVGWYRQITSLGPAADSLYADSRPQIFDFTFPKTAGKGALEYEGQYSSGIQS